MSVIKEFPRQSLKRPIQQNIGYDFLKELQFGVIEETPEMLAAIDEGLESLKREGSIPFEVVKAQLQKKWGSL